MLHLLVLLLMSCIFSGHSWVLENSLEQVSFEKTKNVTLECKYDNKDNGQPRLAKVTQMTIHKFNGSDKWETYAGVRHQQNAFRGNEVGPGVRVKGQADTIHNSFLSMTWSLAFTNISGRYACDLEGYAEDNTPIYVVTDSVSVTQTQLSLVYLLSLVRDVKGQTGKLKDREISRNEIDYIVESKILQWHKKDQWPGGQYALLSTADGCPNPLRSVWTEGYVKFNSESSPGNINTDSVSKISHLAQPVLATEGTRNFVYIRTCKHKTNTTGPTWPKGSYCIHRVGGICPVGFNNSELRLGPEENGYPRGHIYNGPDVENNGIGEHFYFCCRYDEEPTTPVHLPLHSSFYLYRYKGKCQKVYSANVTDEWLQIDTENDYHMDWNLTPTYPDVTMNPTRFFLCYYSKI